MLTLWIAWLILLVLVRRGLWRSMRCELEPCSTASCAGKGATAHAQLEESFGADMLENVREKLTA